MAELDDLLKNLWDKYLKQNDGARAVYKALKDEGEKVVNDHIAFRTFDHPRVNVEQLAKPFVKFGYQAEGDYVFSAKHLRAKHYEHPDENYPLIFISELTSCAFSTELQSAVNEMVDQIPKGAEDGWDFSVTGRRWEITYAGYQRLQAESEYAAWLSAWGYCANHFTVSVNDLENFESLEALNKFLKEKGFALNDSGGEIKGSPEEFLEQSSTMASKVNCEFSDSTQEIPCCYYEFARRYEQPDGMMFRGFIAQSADKIFESTDNK